MQPPNALNTSARLWSFFAAVALIVGTIALVTADPRPRPAGETAGATYTHGLLHVTLPYHAPRAGAGQLTLEVLSPEDDVVGRIQRTVEAIAGDGRWQQEVKLAKDLATDDLVWHRVRYSFTYGDSHDAAVAGTESISRILRTPVIHILGQQAYLAGGAAGVRVVVSDSRNEPIAGASALRIELAPAGQKPRLLYTGAVNRRGTTEAQFRFPAGLVGNFPLRFAVDTPIGSTEFTQQVRLEDKVSILLTTEKPIYQPGQTIHVRALALDRADHHAAAKRALIFEVEDSRGNKVFKKATETDAFGVASAEFSLADEVNLGTYHLRALMGKREPEGAAGGRNTAELALRVERYVLPKFKVAVEFGGKDKAAKHGYRPGDHVAGTVRAHYFFGQAVDGGEVTVKASGMDLAVHEVATQQGRTDRDGAWHFDLKLPDYFAGKPLSHGAAHVLVDATVKDTAGHAETRREPITVSASPLIVTAVPEGGALIPQLENQVFILTSYADGQPAATTVRVHAPGNADQTAATDAGGVAVVRIQGGEQAAKLDIEANDRQGNRVNTSVELAARDGSDQILLRTERAVFRAGDRIQLKIFATRKVGTAYVDLVKDGQTVMTRDVDIVDGRAELDIPVSPDMAGTLDCSVYLFGRDARPVADHRLVFVQPADELKIEAAADAAVYKPGDDARIRFRVTNSRGEGVQAALGLQVVDEAVFALAEKQPGFAKVFFYLEQEVMKPRYEIHSIGMPDVVEPVEAAQAARRDRAARALFSATEMVNANKFETEFGRSVPMAKYAEYNGRYATCWMAQVQHAVERAVPAYLRNGRDLAAALPESRDAWGTPVRVEPARWDSTRTHYTARSAGPDKQFDSVDDLWAGVEIRARKPVTQATAKPSAMEYVIETGRGPFNGRAAIEGTVSDQWGGALEGATLTAREIATGTRRTAKANAAGQFSFSGLTAGEYEVGIAAGDGRMSRKIVLNPRDRAVFTIRCAAGDPAAVVAVTGQGQGFGRFREDGGVVGGVIGGAPGGVMGIRQMAMPMAAPAEAKMMRAAKSEFAADMRGVNTATLAKDEAQPAARTRSYFPEALYINPEIITDQNGHASISIPLADSITTWRMAMVASTVRGALGSGASSLKVFQDFFVDLDLPVTLTQGDRVSIPVAVHNYSGAAGNVNLKLQADDWFALVDDTAAKQVAVESGRATGSQFTLEARRIGKFKLTLAASMRGSDRADIVVREIEVIPDGREQNAVFNGRLDTAAMHDVRFPAVSVPDSAKIFVRLYPGPLSQVIEGMDAILRMPGGCFEQTSSSTYPNVLALDYMKRTKKSTPEVRAKAEGYIANGYQRLLTFEVPGGGFSWFGNAPANKILTGYGLMEFSDMSKVSEVDGNVISRTQQWLASQQQADGSWKPDTSFINEGATNRYNTDVLRITAYLAWSLGNTGYKGPGVERARQFIGNHMDGKVDTYTLAVLANFAVDSAADREFTRRVMERLIAARTEQGEQAWWQAEETGVYATGASAAVETTGLAVQALLKWGGAQGTARKALAYVAAKKDAGGTWGTTQATIMALRALLAATDKNGADVRGTVEIALDGKAVEKLTLTPDNNDLLHQFVFKGVDARASHSVALRFEGKGGLAYQVVGRYFVPWKEKPVDEPLSIDVAYDRTRLAQDDIATATATVKNNLGKVANMVMVDLGIPPGFDLLSEDLEAFKEKTAGQKGGRLEKFSLTATQAILYFDSVAPGSTVTLHYRLRAKYPIRARTLQARVYEYYDPEVSAVAQPQQLEVRKR